MFGWRGGTAPSHRQRAAGGFNPTTCSSNSRQQSRQGSLALPTAPVCRGRTSTTRHSSDGMGPMLSSRPASRQALSDLMDLNLALKFDKMGKHGEKRQPKKRSQSQFTTRGDRDNAGATAGSPSASKRFSALFDRQARHASTRYATPSARFNAEAHTPNTTSASLERTTSHDQLDEAIPVGHKQPAVDQFEWDDCLHPAIPYVAATDIPLMISPSGYVETHLGKAKQGQGSQYTAAPRGSRCSAWKSQGNGGQGSSDKVEEAQGNTSPCQETSSQQSEKDQRMWSALRTSLLSGSEGDTDSAFLGLGRTDEGANPDGGSVDYAEPVFALGGEGRNYAFLKGTRDLEQLDLERSAMDRTMRPHRVASARLLETNQASPVQTKVKQPRVSSASATRSRTRQREPKESVWLGAGGTLQCTGVRAELLSRSGDGSGFCSEPLDGEDIREGFISKINEARNRRREAPHQLARKAEPGRFQWVTNDEGVANFLQRPPSRQKEAFPTHLADVVPQAVFQVETTVADEEAKQHIEATRKKAVEHTRPPSRHKPPGQSLFLEVPDTRRQAPSAFYPPRAPGANATESCGVLPSGIVSMDVPDVEASPTSQDALGEFFALDRRHDNPDRDGFSVLQVQGPCPFRIEVTNSEAGTSSSSKWSSSKFVQPQPPTIPVDREAVAMPNARKTTKFCLPEPPCGLFGPMAYGAGGRANPGIQRAPINTTPGSAVTPVPAGDNAVGKSCAMSYSLPGSRSNGGIALRSGSTPAPGQPQGEDGIAEGGAPEHRPRTGNGSIEPRVEGRSATLVGVDNGGIRKGGVEDGGGRRANTGEGGNMLSGRGDTSGLLVNTGGPVLHVPDWSLQSCDDVDDGAFLDGPVSTMGESGGMKHALLETTLGQDFLSLFAPSSSRGNVNGFSEI